MCCVPAQCATAGLETGAWWQAGGWLENKGDLPLNLFKERGLIVHHGKQNKYNPSVSTEHSAAGGIS